MGHGGYRYCNNHRPGLLVQSLFQYKKEMDGRRAGRNASLQGRNDETEHQIDAQGF